MRKKHTSFLLLSFFFQFLIAQNIKTIQLRPVANNNFTPIVRLGNTLELSFDDLDADNKEYQYKIEHMTYDWQPSDLLPSQYISGYESDYIINVTNSFNTLQNYTHYSVTFPNNNTRITKSGNYLISVLNEDDEVVFTRKCVIYEDKTTVGVSVVRSRDFKFINKKQTVNFTVNYNGIAVRNPSQEIKTVLFQNNNWNTAITGLQPQFFQQNQLIYNYVDKTNYWGGNEYLNFDTKNIRNTSQNIAQVQRKDLYHHYLFSDVPRGKRTYTYNPDINGNFVVRTLESNDENSEADYVMMHFNLEVDFPYKNKEVYVFGAFNNYNFSDENKMTYNLEAKSYQLEIPLKQGFYNYGYATVDESGVDYTAIDGSFFETENEYTVIVYYKPFGEIYDRVIGVGTGFFNQNR